MRSLKWLLAATVTLLLPLHAMADGPQTGTIDGRVLDAQGQPLPGVTVTLTGPRGGRTLVTGSDGVFRFGLLAAGDYSVAASLEGLGEAEASAPLDTGERVTLDLTLRAGAEETITVTAEAALVDRYTVGSSASLETEVAKNLSFKGRNYQSSIEALPGVVHDATSRLQGDHKFALNGGQDTEAAGFVDGVDVSFSRFNGSARMFVPNTVLEEVQLEAAGFSTEYGRVVGGVTNAVVKSGTNRYHGQLLYIPQNQKWRAAFDELDVPREDEIIHSYEANLGGPIARDKAWFFAAYSEQSSNEVDVLRGGTRPIDISLNNEIPVLKLTLQPTERHQITLLGIDSPVEKTFASPIAGDEFSVCKCDIPNELFTGSWGYSLSSSSFFDVRAAAQKNETIRETLMERTIDPDAPPDTPIGNNFSYVDLAARLFHNTLAQAQGEGFLENDRDQANASLSLFRGEHELKFGVDYQDISMATFSDIGRRHFGFGYVEDLPGGYVMPLFVDVFDPAVLADATTDIVSVYAQDRLNVSDRWNVFVGLRLDDQTQDNDVGTEVTSWTKLAPRLAAVYDIKGDGRALLKATAGRYYQVIDQDFVDRVFTVLPNGRDIFDRFGWNPATQRYDRFLRRVVPGTDVVARDIDPYFKDEVTVGTQWQFADAWVFEAQGIWWELDDLFWTTEQFDDQGRVVLDVRNWDAGFRDYVGLRLEVNRAFRNGWTLRTNYTLGENEGNNFGAADNVRLTDDDLFEGLGGVEVGTGATDATIVNREGRGFLDRTHNLNIVGLRQLSLGSHTVSLGGYLGFRSGERWGLRQSTTVVHPVSGAQISTTSYREPRDAQQLDDTFTLNLTGMWNFPLAGRVEGRVGVEVANLTDEQEVIGINRANGRPNPGVFAYQLPREVRLQIGLEF